MSSGEYLSSLTDNATRLGMRLQETFSEHTRDLTRNTYYDAGEDKTKNIRKQLDSSSERDKLAAMKVLLALTSKGRNMADYFAPVVKNVGAPNLELRKLVYIFVLRYAEQEPDLALLSINTFQKDLADASPLIRAMALRVLSGIKVPMIANIVLLAIKKAAADSSPYVRKVAALAIPKCVQLDPGLQDTLVDVIAPMWRDRSPLSIGTVAVAFDAVCPTRLDLLHTHFRRLCKSLVDIDEWGQVELLNLLLRYARTMLPRPKDDEEIDKDLRLLLSSAEPLFLNRNPAVVVAAVRVIYYAGPPSFHPKIVDPLLRILHISPEVERIVLSYILASTPALFAAHQQQFLISYADLPDTKATKLRILLAILDYDNHAAVLRELVDQEAVHEIGRCALRVPECADQCVNALLGMVDRGNDQAVVVLKDLVPAATVERLAGRLDAILDPSARATVVWLAGQYAHGSSSVDGLASYVPDVLRRMAKSFKEEKREVKLQVLTMAAKLDVLSTDSRISKLTRYVMQMARYDADWDVRDRARMLTGLLAGLDPTMDESEREGVVLRREQVKMVLFEGKKTVVEPDETLHATIGTWSAITGKRSIHEPILPDWLENGVEGVLRDSEDDRPVLPPVTAISSASSSQQRAVASAPQRVEPSASWKKNLEAFYDDDDEEEEGEDDSEEEDEGDEEGSGPDSSGEEDEDEDSGDEESEEEDEHPIRHT